MANENENNPDTSKAVVTETTVMEKLLFETLKEQRRRRRWGIFFKFVTVFLALPVIAAISSMTLSGTDGGPTGRHTALIKIDGVIDSNGKVSAESVIKALNKVYSERNVSGVILRINSPGGSPVQAGIIHDEILRLRLSYPEKPLHVVVEETCASGGYYIASAAENIYVDKASIVGSVGVIMSGFGFTGLMDKVGVDRRLIISGKNKALLDPFSPQKEAQKEHIQKMIDQIHQQFITVVRNGRGARLKETEDMFSGLVWTGVQAIELGLADDFGTIHSVSKNVFGNEDIVDYTENEKLSDRLLKRFGTSAGYGAVESIKETEAPAIR